MIKNVGKTDKIVRVVLAVILLGIIFFANFSMTVNIILGIVTLMLVTTSTVGTCPAYLPFKANTCKTDEAA